MTLSLSHSHIHTISPSLSLSNTQTHTFSLSLTHTHKHTHSLSFSIFLTHSHTYTRTHSLSQTHTHTQRHTARQVATDFLAKVWNVIHWFLSLTLIAIWSDIFSGLFYYKFVCLSSFFGHDFEFVFDATTNYFCCRSSRAYVLLRPLKERRTGVNFTNILWAALTCADPKSAKRHWSPDCLFAV